LFFSNTVILVAKFHFSLNLGLRAGIILDDWIVYDQSSFFVIVAVSFATGKIMSPQFFHPGNVGSQNGLPSF
jgi:hypothetical protein